MQSFTEKGESKQKKKCGFDKRKHYNINKYWMPGQNVTEEDLQLLLPVKDFYDTHGYTPTKDDIDTVVELKARFRTWNNVLLAAGLPDKNDPENQRKRMEAANKKKEAAE
ncbi:MAG: hypothetical protein IKU47_01470 [Oscillospiraceae bacterium]|nr:hypothetical protein [Oscillospiraceae bacterium]